MLCPVSTALVPRRANTTNPRLRKIVCRDIDSKHLLLRNAWDLRKFREFRTVYLNHDLTPLQREQLVEVFEIGTEVEKGSRRERCDCEWANHPGKSESKFPLTSLSSTCLGNQSPSFSCCQRPTCILSFFLFNQRKICFSTNWWAPCNSWCIDSGCSRRNSLGFIKT